MPFKNSDDLAKRLLEARLVDPQRLEQSRARLRGGRRPPEELLAALLDAGELTTYQVERLKKGTTDGLVLGGCKLLYRNAAGSFARVYRAAALDDDRSFAVKVLRQRWADDKQTVTLFHREGEIGQQLEHPNIVPIHDVGSQGDFHYFTMDFVEGGNLKDFIKVRRRLDPQEATRYVRDMAEALEYALEQGVTHRDLKMTNVLMSSSGHASLIDFGLAGDERVLGKIAGKAMQRALEYVTLEQGTGAPQDDPRSDLYFLGAIYYQLVSGEPAYPSTRSREERMKISRYRNVPPVRSVAPHLPGAVAEIIKRLMQTDPTRRYQSPAHLLMDLRGALTSMENTPPMVTAGELPAIQANEDESKEKQPTVMCIEDRAKQQDLLREYLSRRGFRVLVLGDVQRGLARLENSPPDCIVLMGGGALGDGIVPAYNKSVRKGRKNGMATIAVLAEEQAHLREKCPVGKGARVMVQPIKLRDLRHMICEMLDVDPSETDV